MGTLEVCGGEEKRNANAFEVDVKPSKCQAKHQTKTDSRQIKKEHKERLLEERVPDLRM